MADVGMEGDYAQWFWDHPFPRYIDPTEPISGIDELSSGDKDDDDEGGLRRGKGR